MSVVCSLGLHKGNVKEYQAGLRDIAERVLYDRHVPTQEACHATVKPRYAHGNGMRGYRRRRGSGVSGGLRSL